MANTGQLEEPDLGIQYYNARWFDPALGHFVQADSIIPNPGSPLAWDRFAYTSNNPVNRVDPSGHADEDVTRGGSSTLDQLILSRKKAKLPPPTVSIGGCTSLCGTTKLDMGEIPMRVVEPSNNPALSYTGFSTSGEEYNNQADFPMPKSDASGHPLVYGMTALDAGNSILQMLYYAFDSPLTASNVYGQVYLQAAPGGITIAGAGIDNRSSLSVEIRSVQVQINQGDIQYLYLGGGGKAGPGTYSTVDVEAPTIYGGQNFTVYISAQSSSSNTNFFGTISQNWDFVYR